MRIKTFNIIIAFVLVFSLSSCAQSTKEAKAEVVQKEQFKKLISPKDLNAALGDIQLIDIRTPREFASGHIKGSENINFYDPSFIDKMSKFDKNKIMYIYCRSGSRSRSAVSKLQRAGFTKIYDLQGGIINWSRNNLESVR